MADDQDDDLQTTVFINLDYAKENGAFDEAEGGELVGATAEQIAVDLVSGAENCEEYSAEEVLPYVKEWMKRHAN